MKAIRTGTMIELASPTSGAAVQFTRIAAGIAWGDLSSDDEARTSHAMVLGGETPGGTIDVWGEWQGNLTGLLVEVKRCRDDLLLGTAWVERDPKGHAAALFRENGITYHTPNPEAPTLHLEMPTIVVIRCSERFTDDIEAARSFVDKLGLQGDIRLSKTLIPNLQKSGSQRTADSLQLPIFRAFLALAWGLWHSSEKRLVQQPELPERWPWEEFNGK